MTSGQAQTQSQQQQPQQYDWSNIATIRRSINRNRSNAADRYPKYGDPIRFARERRPETPIRSGSTEMCINFNNGSTLYPHLEERPTTHNLRSAKSEYFLPQQQQSQSHANLPPSPSYSSSSCSCSNQQQQQRRCCCCPRDHHHFLANIDDDTKWIKSSSSTASYHSGNSRETDDECAHLYSEICKPVSIASLPPLDRGAHSPYRNYSTRLAGINCGNYNVAARDGTAAVDNGPGGGVCQQQTTNGGVVGEANDLMLMRNAKTPPPPPSMLVSTSHMGSIAAGQHQHHQQPRKYFTLNPPRSKICHTNRNYHSNGRNNYNEEEAMNRRRSMIPTETIREAVQSSNGCGYGSQVDVTGAVAASTQMNRSQSCYVDPLDYKVGCQNTLRSKPLIPWYELAIKDNNRRSCPQFEVDYLLGFISRLLCLFIGNSNWDA